MSTARIKIVGVGRPGHHKLRGQDVRVVAYTADGQEFLLPATSLVLSIDGRQAEAIATVTLAVNDVDLEQVRAALVFEHAEEDGS